MNNACSHHIELITFRYSLLAIHYSLQLYFHSTVNSHRKSSIDTGFSVVIRVNTMKNTIIRYY
jgi:hypothetical protein